MTARQQPKNLWFSRWGFILAATGSAVGLGNIWKFPYITGEYGGGAFVLVYLACILAVGVPVMMAEIAFGRRGRGSPIEAIANLAREAGACPLWKVFGWIAMLAGFMILSFYVVVAGWSFSYLWKMASGALSGHSVAELGAIFEAGNANPWALGGWATLVTVVTMLIVGRGVQEGVEKSVRWMMPGMVIMLLIMIGYALTSGNFSAGFHFLFDFDVTRLSSEGVLAALGHAFFTLSLASGAILTYGSYLPSGTSIARTTFTVAIADTLVALMAGLAIFPIIFANGMDPSSGPGLIFMSLPVAFNQMPFGQLFGVLFFAMLSIAALTSAISMIEATVAWLSENRNMSRTKASWLAGSVLWLVAMFAMLSFNLGADWTLAGKHFFDWLDYLTSRWMMPIGGIAMALLAGFVFKSSMLRDELNLSDAGYRLWLFMIRYVSPVCILAIFVDALGVAELSFDDWPYFVAVILAACLVGELLSPRLRERAAEQG